MFSVPNPFKWLPVKRLAVSMLIVFTGFGYMSSLSAQEDLKQFSSTEQPSQLVELYTSQGCSSCPPAERWISNFKHDQRLWKSIFPVAFHVDYWDYIGWKDEFARPEFGSRQRLYQRLGFLRQVATPGFVVSGKGWNGWYRGQRLPQEQTVPGLGDLQLEVSNRKIDVTYLAEQISNLDPSFKINLALLGFDLRSEIDAGENRGRDLSQDFVVLSLYREFLLNDLDGSKAQQRWHSQMRLPEAIDELKGGKALVAWVSKGGDPRPLQIAGGWL